MCDWIKDTAHYSLDIKIKGIYSIASIQNVYENQVTPLMRDGIILGIEMRKFYIKKKNITVNQAQVHLYRNQQQSPIVSFSVPKLI